MNVDELARALAFTSANAVQATVGEVGVFVRLDERGGKTDPAPWAFHTVFNPPEPAAEHAPPLDVSALRAELADEPTLPSVEVGAIDAVFTGKFPAADAEETAAYVHSLPMPAARGAATVLPIKKTGSLPGPAFHLGRAGNNDVVVDEMSVSKAHAKVFLAGSGDVTLLDAGSRNGTQLNGRALEQHASAKLVSGDRVTFGDVECVFLAIDALATQIPRMTD